MIRTCWSLTSITRELGFRGWRGSWQTFTLRWTTNRGGWRHCRGEPEWEESELRCKHFIFQCQHQVHRAWPRVNYRGGEGHQGGAAEHPAFAVHWRAGEDRADEKSGLSEGWSDPPPAVWEFSGCFCVECSWKIIHRQSDRFIGRGKNSLQITFSINSGRPCKKSALILNSECSTKQI